MLIPSDMSLFNGYKLLSYSYSLQTYITCSSPSCVVNTHCVCRIHALVKLLTHVALLCESMESLCTLMSLKLTLLYVGYTGELTVYSQ